jgi:hypothetical protein
MMTDTAIVVTCPQAKGKKIMHLCPMCRREFEAKNNQGRLKVYCITCATMRKKAWNATGDKKRREARKQIQHYITICKEQQRELTDTEYKKASRLNWKLCCPNHKCNYYYYSRTPYNSLSDPCIECQTAPVTNGGNHI